jgi:phage FluMu protein Com
MKTSPNELLQNERRCPCGNLLARRHSSEITVKCRRCKRQVVIASTTRPSELPGEIRCACGNLLALRSAEGVQIKCRRCKRAVIVHAFAETETPAASALTRRVRLD